MKISKNYFDLVSELAKREIKARYKQSVLGFFWIIANPLSHMLTLAFIFSIIVKVPSENIPYPLFLFIGLLPWTLFANTLTHSSRSLIDNAPLLKQVSFPRDTLVLSTLLAKTLDFFVASMGLLVLFLVYQQPIGLNALWFLFLLCFQLIFTFGLGLVVASLNLFYRDVQHILSLLLILGMYLTPVIYPLSLVPEKFRIIFKLNPMSILIHNYRLVLTQGSAPEFTDIMILLIISLGTVIMGYWLFKHWEGGFGDAV
ncbi:ABC transporter permease [Candidatus Microgenomates bacterium]|nr:MAG: ABC transporter permease [Candidatus Microgenomates bacterium]